jgi:hypothetical protein
MAEETTAKESAEPKRAPAPETVDQTKSTVTQEQVQAMEEAAPQPTAGESATEAPNGSEEDLNDYTVDELRGIAQSEGVELHGATVKADIIKAIKKNRKNA